MLSIALPIILAIAAWVCPAKITVVLMIINLFVPDSIPYADEIIQAVGLVKSLASGNV